MKSGVQRFKDIFSPQLQNDGERFKASESSMCGITAGADSAIFIPLTGSFRQFVKEFFMKEKGMAQSQAVEADGPPTKV